ncbi:hypothetical protein F5I97DRAFT_713372 [Phlebopus sp. FC_14]|nr:hypothetical protein F5I97DRAFT_713372 [Phlebopus sp. FC_14]
MKMKQLAEGSTSIALPFLWQPPHPRRIHALLRSKSTWASTSLLPTLGIFLPYSTLLHTKRQEQSQMGFCKRPDTHCVENYEVSKRAGWMLLRSCVVDSGFLSNTLPLNAAFDSSLYRSAISPNLHNACEETRGTIQRVPIPRRGRSVCWNLCPRVQFNVKQAPQAPAYQYY